MAGDLRQIVTAIKTIGEIERSGDLAVNICKGARRLYGVQLDSRLRGMIVQTGEQATQLFSLSIDSYVDADVPTRLRARRHGRHPRPAAVLDFIAQIFKCHAAEKIELQVAVQPRRSLGSTSGSAITA